MLDNQQVKGILKYSANRKYFGDLTAAALSDAYRALKKSTDWEKPITESPVLIGRINGKIICEGLWKLMSINPVRYGTVSPFIFNNRNNIYKFCDSKFHDAPHIETIRYSLIKYLTLNASPNGQWYDEIYNINGYARIKLENGYTDKTYKALSTLCHCARTVSEQNVSDWSDKHAPYREQIANAIMKMKSQQMHAHENLEELQSEYNKLIQEIERLDDNIENCKINLESSSPTSPVYQQSISDLISYEQSLTAATKSLREIESILKQQQH